MKNRIFAALCMAALLPAGLRSTGGATVRADQTGSALHPFVCDGYLVGGSQNGQWLTDKQIWRRIRGGERYQVYSATARTGASVGNAATTKTSVTGEQPEVELKPAHEDDRTLAICADWNAQPRPVTQFSNQQAAYVSAAADVLKRHGMGIAQVNVTKVLQVDLDGDGTKEVLIAATTPRSGYPEPGLARSDYSFILLRRLVNGRVKTTMIEGEFGGEMKDRSRAYSVKYELIGAFDLNGDGKMEIVTRNSYYEGSSVTVYRMGASGVKSVLEVGDGA